MKGGTWFGRWPVLLLAPILIICCLICCFYTGDNDLGCRASRKNTVRSPSWVFGLPVTSPGPAIKMFKQPSGRTSLAHKVVFPTIYEE